ncbi:heat shock factor protein isoform X2 [Uranotaenia lowii]|uniref:heat shock factor protein isoform X2 n=1 Tax=Uranotaenia lowii TaxID=190385 RepID=UPI00247849BE|nr:heat shock factor protein isoform X2 [Uranotaenia lowii]
MMHSFSESGAGVPAFLAKLWRLVEDPETNDLISWSSDGRSFIIQNQAQFAKELLPLNYKHNNMASFIRQLNMYGFHKITSIDNGGLRFDKDEMEFTHPCFQKDHPYLLEHIKRKIATAKQQQQDDKGSLKLEVVNRVLTEVKNMRGRQESLDSRFSTMKQENEALWREIAILRQKHLKQQQIVNKLIQFLVTIVQPSRGGLSSMGNASNKRRFQLMINEAPANKTKKSNEGATIEELGEVLEGAAFDEDHDLLSICKDTNNDSVKATQSKSYTRDSTLPEVTSPQSINHQSPYHPENVNEIIEEVVSSSPNFRSSQRRNVPIRPNNSTNRTAGIPKNINQLLDDNKQNMDDGGADFENEDYLVDHVEEGESDPNQFYNDMEMLHTPMVIKEMEKQEQLKRQPTQKVVFKGESLLKGKQNGASAQNQKSGATNGDKKHEYQNNDKKSILTSKQITIVDDADMDAGPSGSNNFTANADVAGRSSVGFDVEDFIVNEVPNDIFEDNGQTAKESPMLGGFNFEPGFYNPNVNINEIKTKQTGGQSQTFNNQTGSSNAASHGNVGVENEAESSNTGSGTLARFISNDIDLNKFTSVIDYGQHIDSVQTDLDSLKELLKGEGYQLDANALLGPIGTAPPIGRFYFAQPSFDADALSKLFSGNEDIMGYEFPMNLPEMSNEEKKNANDGTVATFSTDNSSGSSGHTPGTPYHFMAYRNAAGGQPAATDYIDLNALLSLEENNNTSLF